MEEWLKIDEKPNYSVSNTGRIRNDKTGRILKLHKSTNGYYQVMLGRKTVPLYVHRIVAKAFIPNEEGFPQVDHKNGDKSDNRAENLRWVSVSGNCLNFGYEQRIEHRKRKVIARKDNTEMLFNSRDEVAQYFKCNKAHVKYGWLYKKGNKAGWTFYKAEDIV